VRSAGLRARALDFFIEPQSPDDPAAPSTPTGSSRDYLAPAAPAIEPVAARCRAVTRMPVRSPAAPTVEPVAARSRAVTRMPVRTPAVPTFEPARAESGTATHTPLRTPAAAAVRPAAAPAHARTATRMPVRAAVLGVAAEAVPVGALLANALRSAAGVSTAGLAVWTPGESRTVRGGPATFAASRLAARLSARGLPAVGRGRLAWLPLDDHPVAATVATRRAGGALEVPLVVVLCGPRCEVVEGLLVEQDLVVVAAADPDGPLARLAVGCCATAAVACPAPAAGPPRWLAWSGAASGRTLPAPLRSLVRGLATPAAPEPVEDAW
jgi:hypothetical protein